MNVNVPTLGVAIVALGALFAWGVSSGPGRPGRPAVRSEAGTPASGAGASRAARAADVPDQQLRAMTKELASLREALSAMRRRQDAC